MGESHDSDDLLRRLVQLAADLGPVLRPRGEREALDAITETARIVLDAAACSIAVLDDKEQLEFRSASGQGAEGIIGVRISGSTGIAGWAVMSGQAVAIEDVRQGPRFAADVAASTGYVPRSIMAMPLETEQRSLGVIEVLDRQAHGGTGAADMELLALFARQATLVLESADVFSRMGRALLAALAEAAPDGDLQAALQRRADDAPRSQTELAELALLFHRLGDAGPQERIAAAQIANDFLAYTRRLLR
jgi:GAF domain-containing protein